MATIIILNLINVIHIIVILTITYFWLKFFFEFLIFVHTLFGALSRYPFSEAEKRDHPFSEEDKREALISLFFIVLYFIGLYVLGLCFIIATDSIYFMIHFW